MKQIYYIFLFCILLPYFSRGEAVLPNGHFYMFISGGGGMSESQPVKLDYDVFTLHFDVMAYDNVIVVPAENEGWIEAVPEDSVSTVNRRHFSSPADPDRPIEPDPLVRCWFEYLRYEDDGGQVGSLICQYGSSRVVFRSNPHPYTVYGKLTIYYNSVFPNEDTGNSSSTTSPAGSRRELHEMHIYYRQLPRIALKGGTLPARLSFNAGDRCLIEGSAAEGGQGNYVYQWEQMTASGWELISWAGSQNLTYSVPVDGLLLRRKVSSRSEMAYSNVCMLRENVFGNRNYMLHSRALNLEGTASQDFYREDITYYDGLGRPVQSVALSASPTGGDIITPLYYDSAGRSDSRMYLPYVLADNRGAYDESSFVNQSSYYTTLYADEGRNAYNENRYESFVSDRVKEAWKVGKVFRENDKKTAYTYHTNVSNEVFMLSASESGVLTVGGYYNFASLRKTRVRDEDGYKAETFTDLDGRTVLERRYGSGSEYADTYSVYDVRGRLVAVISPEGSSRLSVGKSYSLDDPVMDGYVYFYRYDGRDRVIEKKVPGSDREYFVYDKGDRVALWQDGNLRAEGKWRLSVYDGLGRLKAESLLINHNSRSALQVLFDSGRGSSLSSGGTLLHEYRYDAYESGDPAYIEISAGGSSGGVSPVSFISAEKDNPGAVGSNLAAVDYILRPYGLLTWEKVAVLEGNNVVSGYVERASYYDKRGRLLQTVEHYPDGGGHYVMNSYDFKGDIVRSEESCRIGKTFVPVLVNDFSYDSHSRLEKVERRLSNKVTAKVRYEYDALGLVRKRIYGDSAAIETLSYNLQGWLTDQSSPAFRMSLRYYDPDFSGSPVSYTGNISEWSWCQGEEPFFTYSFSYDNYGRFKDSRSFSNGTQTNQYTEYNLRYDRNGNIRLLMRRDGSGKCTTDYTYSYAGNQLVGIAEDQNQLIGVPDTGLVAVSGTSDYVYDLNGNLKIDNRRGLNYQYNYLNLLSEASRSGVSQARYRYTAGGEKVGVADASGRGYDYRGSFQYRRDGSSLTLEGVLFGEGRISAGSHGYKAYYYLKDHLGSIRAVIDSLGNVCERNDYYPFGLEHQRGDYPQLTENRLKYNGKEKQDVGELDFLDYGARFYDRDLGRWFVADPLQENYYSWSPYTYCINNPLKFVDPTGAAVDDYFNSLGYYLGTDDAASDIVRIISREDWNKHKRVHADGSESIPHQIGKELSVKHSQSFLFDDQSLRIYNHYNPTDLPIGKNEDKEKAGMSFRVRDGFVSIGVNLDKNREEKVSDHAHTIKNMFVHENQHYEDYKRMGAKTFNLCSEVYKENRAIRVQMDDSTFKLTGFKYQNSVKKYERKVGLPLMPVMLTPIELLINQ